MVRRTSRVSRAPIAIAAGGLALAGAVILARGSTTDRIALRTPGPPRCAFASAGGREGPALERAPTAASGEGESVEDRSVTSSDPRITEFVAALKAGESGTDASPVLASSLSELLQSFPLDEALRQIGRHAPLEQGFSVLKQLISESPLLRKSVLDVLGAVGGDEETRLFALRLLPPFRLLADGSERGALLGQLERLPEGELGRQLVRYASAGPADVEVSARLVRLLEWHGDPEIKADVLRGLVRFPDPVAASALKRCFEDPDTPASQRATVLGALAGSGAPQGASLRYPWLANALESSIRLRPGDAFDADQERLVSYAVTLLAQSGESRKLCCLLESEKVISDPGGRALIASALCWLPGPEAAETLASVASNPAESPKVRLIALESLRGRRSPDLLRRLSPVASEPGVPPDVQSALEELLRDP